MKVAAILKHKGDKVLTTSPDAGIDDVARVLKENRIGAMVVSADGVKVDGILSERDIVHALVDHGAATLKKKVSDLMTREVFTCSPDDGVEDLMAQMTERRIRHLPVVEGGGLKGIVSIGDVVKVRMQEVESEASALRDFITGY